MQPQKAPHSNSDPEKKEVGGLTLPNIEQYYKAIVIKTAWHWHKNRHRSMEQNRQPRNKPTHLYSQLIFNRGSEHIQWAKDSLFNRWFEENCTDTCRKMTLDHLTPHTRINSERITDLNC